MESESLKFDYIQSAKIGYKQQNKHCEFLVDDDEILLPSESNLGDNEETWLYAPVFDEDNGYSNKQTSEGIKSKSIYDWLGLSPSAAQLTKRVKPLGNEIINGISSSILNNSSQFQSVINKNLISSNSDQRPHYNNIPESSLNNGSKEQSGIRKFEIDSRTYTRPKKKTLHPSIITAFTTTGDGFNVDGSTNSHCITSENGDGGILNGLQPQSSTSSTILNSMQNNYVPSSFTNNSPMPTTCTSSDKNTACYSNINNTSSDNCINRTPPNVANPNKSLTSTPSTSSCSSTNNVTPYNDTMSSSLGIIDIDQLTDSQLGLTNMLDKTEDFRITPLTVRQQQQQHYQGRQMLTPSVVSEHQKRMQQNNWKYKLDESLLDIITPPQEFLTKSNTITNKLTTSNKNNNTFLVQQNVSAIRSTSCQDGGLNDLGNYWDDKSKQLFNANELLQISFPSNTLISDISLSVDKSDSTFTADGINKSVITNDDVNSLSDVNTTVFRNNNSKLINNWVDNSRKTMKDICDLKIEENSNKECVTKNKSDVYNDIESGACGDASPVSVCNKNTGVISVPISSSTPLSNKIFNKIIIDDNPVGNLTFNRGLINKKLNLEENNITENSNSGRLSGSSTDSNLPSISMEDLSSEQISPIGPAVNLNQTYNAEEISSAPNVIDNNVISPKSKKNNGDDDDNDLNRTYTLNNTEDLNRTYNLGDKSEKNENIMNTSEFSKLQFDVHKTSTNNILNNTISISPAQSKRSMLNTTFNKSALNTTFRASTEMLNGTISNPSSIPISVWDRGSEPEDDCMSTASDSSFSSSSTHMRSVCEIQSIARLQEESLRKQTNIRRKYAWEKKNGLSDPLPNDLRRSMTRLSVDIDNQSDKSSDQSSERYSPTTFNNNDRDVFNTTIVKMKSPRRIPLPKFGGSTEMLTSGLPGVSSVSSETLKRVATKMSGLRPPTVFNRPASAAQSVNSMCNVSIQPPSLIRPVSGIRPPSVIPRPASRLPAPKVRSGLPKYNVRGGRQ